MSKSSTLRLECQMELNKRIVIPRCDSACTFFFQRAVPSACALHGLCAMSSNMMQYDMGMLRSCFDCTKLSTMLSSRIKHDLGMLLSCFDCTKLSAQNGKFALQTFGGSPTSSDFKLRRKHKQPKPRKRVSGNMSDENTNQLNRESQFLATTPLIEIRIL